MSRASRTPRPSNQRQPGRRKRFPGALAAALFFLGTLFPALGFFDVYPFLFSFVADHFQYLASIGIIALAAAALTSLPRRASQALSVAVLAILAALTWKQSHLYADAETLYRATLRGNPGCWMAYNNLSGLLIAGGAADEAAGLARNALELRPDYPEAHNNLALALARSGQVEEAIAHYRKAVDLSPGYAERCRRSAAQPGPRASRTNTPIDSTCAVCGNMLATPATASVKPRSCTNTAASRASVAGLHET